MAKFINILLVDDDADDHQFFQQALKHLKIGGRKASEVISLSSVYNGAQALDYLYRRGAYSTNQDPDPDFVIVDLNMPVMDGYEMLKETRKSEKLKSIPYYVLTTSRDESHKMKCKELGCAGFFSKPPNLEELKIVIGKIFNADSE